MTNGYKITKDSPQGPTEVIDYVLLGEKIGAYNLSKTEIEKKLSAYAKPLSDNCCRFEGISLSVIQDDGESIVFGYSTNKRAKKHAKASLDKILLDNPNSKN